MKKLTEFEGVAGFRWGALLGANDDIRFSQDAPEVAPRKIALIEQVLGHAAIQLDQADLVFASGRVLIRRGGFGLLILFCENNVNLSMVDIVLREEWLSKEETKARKNSDSSRPGKSSIPLNPLHPIRFKNEDVPLEIVEELLDLFTRYLGPLARILARKDCREAGLDMEHLPARDWFTLLHTLADRISDETKRDAFLDQAVLLKNKF